MKRIEGIVRKSAMSFGLIAVEVEIRKGKINAVLYNKAKDVSVGDLERVTRKIQDELVTAGLGGIYAVSLSSAGLDRILKSEKELEIFLGRMVKASYFEDGKTITRVGTLAELKNGCIILKNDKVENEIELKRISSVRLWDKMFEKGGNKK